MPYPQFYFKVEWGSSIIHFSEISGLDNKTPTVEYRHGDSSSFYPIEMPGIGKVNKVTMKRGIFQGNSDYWQWYSEIKLGTGFITMIVIQLLNENGNPTMEWTLNDVKPAKITTTDTKPEGNNPSIESLEVEFGTMIIKNTNNP